MGAGLTSESSRETQASAQCSAHRPGATQAIELNTVDFRSGGAFADALLSLASRAGPDLQTIRLVTASPGRAKQSLLYGGSERLCMYRGAQVCPEPYGTGPWPLQT